MIKPKIIFAPGCFDNFEGTQEELDATVKQIYDMVESGELFTEMESFEDMDQDELEEYLSCAEINIRSIDPPSRTLQ